MVLAELGTPWWIAFSGILLFLVLVVLRFALTLVKQVKDLSATVKDASERMQDALAEVEAESRLASERAERLQETRGAQKRR